jgi:O-antigen ligase
LNSQNHSLENSPWDWDLIFHNLVTWGLIAITFGLFFVRLNHLVEYTFFFLLIVWIGVQWKNGTLKWIKTPLDVPILLYVTWALICVPFAVDPTYSFGEWKKTVAQILLFYFAVQTIKTQQQIHLIFLAGSIGLGVLSAAETSDFFLQGRSMWDMGYRAGDLTGSSQWFSVYLVVGLPLLWFGLKFATDFSSWVKASLWGCLGISLLGLLVAHTRAAWVAVGIQVFIYLLLRVRKNWWMVMGGAGIVVCSFLVLLSLPSIFGYLSGISSFANTESMLLRFNTWSLALQDITDRPLTGIGLGKHSFRWLHPGLAGDYHTHVHNTFLSKAVQVGIPGFLFFVGIFWVVLSRGGDIFKRIKNDFVAQLSLAVNLIVVGVIVRILFDDMLIGTVAYLFWLCLGVFFSIEKAVGIQLSMKKA